MVELHKVFSQRESPKEMGAKNESIVQEWLDFKNYHYFYIDQRWDTFAIRFEMECLKRPDWFVVVQCMGKRVIIAIDAKSRTFNKEYGNYTLGEKDEVQKLLNFQRAWDIPVWLVLASPVEPYTRHWISLTEIVETMELKTNRVTGNQFRTILIKDCITIGWNDGLEKLFF